MGAGINAPASMSSWFCIHSACMNVGQVSLQPTWDRNFTTTLPHHRSTDTHSSGDLDHQWICMESRVYKILLSSSLRKTRIYVLQAPYRSAPQASVATSRPNKARTSLPLGTLPKNPWQHQCQLIPYHSRTRPKVTHVECSSSHCNQNIVR
jgi:hypothetical protein